MQISQSALDKFSREAAKAQRDIAEKMRQMEPVAAAFARALQSFDARLRDFAASREPKRGAK